MSKRILYNNMTNLEEVFKQLKSCRFKDQKQQVLIFQVTCPLPWLYGRHKWTSTTTGESGIYQEIGGILPMWMSYISS